MKTDFLPRTFIYKNLSPTCSFPNFILSKISEFMVLYSVTSFKIPKISKASKPTVISRNNATKTLHLEQGNHILTLTRWYREKYITTSDSYTHANLLCTGLVEPSHKLARSKPRRDQEHTRPRVGGRGGGRERVKSRISTATSPETHTRF